MRLAAISTLALALAMSGPAFAQTPGDTEPGYKVPHTSWGAPDLTGFWSNASLTTMQRPDAAKSLVVTEDEAKRLVYQNVYSAAQRQEAGKSKVDDKSSKELLSDGNANRAYNRFWMDPGAGMAVVRGQYHTSWI